MEAGSIHADVGGLGYETGHVVSKESLDFGRESDLINKLDPLDRNKLISEVDSRKPFRPFSAMLEGRFLANFHLPDYLRSIWQFLIKSNLLCEKSIEEIESLVRLPDWELIERFKSADYPIGPNQYGNSFEDGYIMEAEQKNPAARYMVNDYIFQDKPTLKGRYNSEDHLVYSFEDMGKPPLVYFPVSARESIPNAPDFYGRVCGIVNFVPNPPLQGMPTLIFRTDILALPLKVM